MKEIRESDLKGVREYHKYIKDVEMRMEEQRKRERQQSEIEFDNYLRQHHDHAKSHFATFYEPKVDPRL